MINIIAWIIFGLIAGAIARFLKPGNDAAGWITTIICHVLKKVYTFYINTKIRLQFKYNPKIDLQSPFFCNNFSIYNLPF